MFHDTISDEVEQKKKKEFFIFFQFSSIEPTISDKLFMRLWLREFSAFACFCNVFLLVLIIVSNHGLMIRTEDWILQKYVIYYLEDV